MFFNIKEKLLKRKLIITLENMAEKLKKELFLVSTVKISKKNKVDDNKYIYAIKIVGKSKISEDIIDKMIIVLEIFKNKKEENKKFNIKIIDNIKLNQNKFTDKEQEEINRLYSKLFED